MSKTLEAIVKETIDVNRIAQAIRAEGYRIPIIGKTKEPIQGFAAGYLITALQSPGRIIQLKDGWFKDFIWGIDWSPKSLEKFLPWGEAAKYCAEVGRRLSEHYELESFRDLTKYNPAIIEAAKVLKLEPSYYWTKSPYAGGPDGAWFVGIEHGFVYTNYKAGNSYCRPVRVSQ